MPSIEDKALQTYQNNLTYLQTKQPRVYEKLASFDSAVANGHYQERYDLEYKDGGYFDVKEINSDNYLYGSNTNEYAKDVASSIDYKKEDNIFIISPRYKFSKEFLKKAKDEPIDANNFSAVAPLIDLLDKKIPKNSTMKRHEKFIFFGVGLGTHLESVDKKIRSDFYLIVEDDLELFRLSLFVCDYSKLARKSELYFSVFEDDEDARVIMNEFLEDGFMHNHYIKFLHMLHHSDKKMRLFHEVVASQTHQLFPYHAYFHKFLRVLEYMRDDYKFLKLTPENSPFEDHPVLILAAGPSLHQNIKWVKKNQDRFVTIALTSSLSTLEQEDIIPDIVVHLDPFAKGSIAHLEKLKNRDYFNKCIYLFGAQSPKELVKMFDKNRVFIFENGTSFKKGFGLVQATCVGSVSYALTLALKAKEIYLLGLDLAIDEKSGRTHSSSHAHSKVLDTDDVDKLQKIFNFKDSLIKVRGNFKDEVLTTANFYMSIENVVQNTKVNKKPFQKIYNLSNGAYFERIDPLKISNITKLPKIDKSNLFSNFLQNSSDRLSQSELDSIEKMRDHATEVKNILKKHHSKRFMSSEEYQYALMGLSLDITAKRDMEASSLNTILLRYMQFVYPYIFDYLNTNECKDYRDIIKVVDQLLVKNLKKIAVKFEKECENFFEKEDA